MLSISLIWASYSKGGILPQKRNRHFCYKQKHLVCLMWDFIPGWKNLGGINRVPLLPSDLRCVDLHDFIFHLPTHTSLYWINPKEREAAEDSENGSISYGLSMYAGIYNIGEFVCLARKRKEPTHHRCTLVHGVLRHASRRGYVCV